MSLSHLDHRLKGPYAASHNSVMAPPPRDAPSHPRRVIRLYYGAPGSPPRSPAIHNYIHEAGHVAVIEGTHFYKLPRPITPSRRALRPGFITAPATLALPRRAAPRQPEPQSVPPSGGPPLTSTSSAAVLLHSSLSSQAFPLASTSAPPPHPPRLLGVWFPQ